jgi:tRNA(Met) cytidine acetyltransferase
MHDFKQYKTLLEQLKQQLAGAKHRQLVLITGSEHWCYELLTHCMDMHTTAVLSKHAQFKQAIWPQHTHQLLGQEFTNAIYDGFSGLYPDKLAALAGTIKAGGLLFLLLPELNILKHWQDPAMGVVQSHGHTNKFSYFNQRFARTLDKLPLVHFSEATGSIFRNNQHQHNNINFEPQQHCIEQIISLANGRANRPLLINADRGRGKSAALGLSAAQLSCKKIIICATQFKACHSSFKHLANALSIEYNSEHKQIANLQYVAPDALLNTLPNCDLLFVDEAAVIPVPMLLKMLHHYPRIVFASTLVGYEGNGRGYTIRFSQHVKARFKAAKIMSLNEPLRFAKQDPLEQHIRRLLALDAQYASCSNIENTGVNYAEISQQQLINNEALLEQVVALLALAHYQSSVNDLRYLLDSSAQRLFISHQQDVILGVCLVAIEGGVNDEVAEHIILGKRRPQGHLMAQTLAQLSTNPLFLTQHCARVVRIAVAPEHHNKQLGSALIAYSQQQLKGTCQWFGASFGANVSLLKFWQAAGFNVVKLGYQQDKATAEHAALVVKSLTDDCTPVTGLIDNFNTDFPLQLIDHFNELDTQLIVAIIRQFPEQKSDITQSKRLTTLLRGEYQLHTIKPVLWRFFWHSPKKLADCDEHTQIIFTRLILQNWSIENTQTALNILGRKALNTHIKHAINRYLSITNSI